jgi:quercetin dioxygenase-like cupin family protein
MDVQHIPWNGEQAPGEGTLRRALEAEGYEVTAWRDPSDRTYESHSHPHDESLWVVRGQIVLRIQGQEFPLGPGDRLMLPRNTVHTAQAGPEGAIYLIGRPAGRAV